MRETGLEPARVTPLDPKSPLRVYKGCIAGVTCRLGSRCVPMASGPFSLPPRTTLAVPGSYRDGTFMLGKYRDGMGPDALDFWSSVSGPTPHFQLLDNEVVGATVAVVTGRPATALGSPPKALWRGRTPKGVANSKTHERGRKERRRVLPVIKGYCMPGWEPEGGSSTQAPLGVTIFPVGIGGTSAARFRRILVLSVGKTGRRSEVFRIWSYMVLCKAKRIPLF
jgi:hypothetical protein